jgi:HPt (histidine-containing phosphotransfer) domain-containing protein
VILAGRPPRGQLTSDLEFCEACCHPRFDGVRSSHTFDRVRAVAEDWGDTLDVRALDALRETVGGDQEFLSELISEFLADAPRQLDSLRAAAASGDAETARRAAHTLKSHGATFGVKRLEAACRTLEAHAREDDLGDVEGLVVEIEDALAESRPALEELAAGEVPA